MPTEEEIQAIIKKAYNAKLPDWKKNYLKRISENLMVHTKGLLFSKVDALFPHEHPDSKAHSINSYEPITKGSIWKGINDVIRIFSNSSFTVSASDKTLEYANAPLFDGSNLFNWFLDKWVNEAIAKDPNSLCAVYPPDYGDDKEEGAELIRFIKSENILLYPDGDICVFISEEESEKTCSVVDQVMSKQYFYDETIDNINARMVVEKTYNQKIEVKITKKVFHVFTKEYFIKFIELDGGEFDFEYIPYIKPVDLLPVFKVCGGPELMEEIHESFVNAFVPFGNLALLQHRNHRAVDLMFSYPRMSEIQTPCDALDCNDGYVTTYIVDPANPDGKTACGRCKGSGFITSQSPYKVYQKKLSTGLTDPEIMKLMLSAAPVDFHTPDTSILEYSKNAWKDYLSMAEEAIYIQQKQMTGNVESAKKAEIDREGKYAWLQNISKSFYGTLRMLMQCNENYINASPSKVSVEVPTSFAILTDTEAFEELNIILSSPAPVMIKAQKVESFINKFVSKSSPIIKALKILKQFDPLLFYSNADVQGFKSNNAVSMDSWIKHIYAYPVLMQLYEIDKEIFEKEPVAIMKSLQTEIDKLKPADDLKASIQNAAA